MRFDQRRRRKGIGNTTSCGLFLTPDSPPYILHLNTKASLRLDKEELKDGDNNKRNFGGAINHTRTFRELGHESSGALRHHPTLVISGERSVQESRRRWLK